MNIESFKVSEDNITHQYRINIIREDGIEEQLEFGGDFNSLKTALTICRILNEYLKECKYIEDYSRLTNYWDLITSFRLILND